MRRFLSKLFRGFRTTSSARGGRQAPHRVTLQVEGLEDRRVPAVVFNSVFGGDTIFWVPGNSAHAPANEVVTAAINYNPSVLNSTTVYLDFWGNSWTQANAAPLAGAAQSIIQSRFFSLLSDYGFHGTVNFGGYTVDNTHTSQGNTTSDPQAGQNTTTEIQNLLNGKLATNANLPTSSWLRPQDNRVQDSPIYIVVYDNGGSGFNTPAHYSNSLMMNEISMGDGGNQDHFTDEFSHEMAERISAGDGTGIEMNATNAHTDGEYQNSQISDNEPDENNYQYRINGPTGQLVQAYWSTSYNGFVVPDGNSQTLYLDPIWNFPTTSGSIPSFTGHSNLVVNGGQLNNQNDTITLNETWAGGVSVTLNGELFQFDAGKINTTYVNTSDAYSTVNVLGTPWNTSTFIDDYGTDTVVVGNTNGNVDNGAGYMDNIHGAVYIDATGDIFLPGSAQLYLDDSSNNLSQTVTMRDAEIDFGQAAPIYYSSSSSGSGGVISLGLYGGYGGNTFNVDYTSNLYSGTYLNTGTGNDTVNVYATQGSLDVYNPGGNDITSVEPGNMSSINGSVSVSGEGSTTLNINDSSDTTGRTVWMNDGSFMSLGSAAIYWTPTSSATGGVNFVEVEGGSGGNTFDVYNTSNLAYETFLDTGMGNDTVNVFGTLGSLYVYNPGGNDTTTVGPGNLSYIHGLVNVEGPGTTWLTVSDQIATAAESYTITSSSISRSGSAGINYSGGVRSVTVNGGNDGNSFNVSSDAASTFVTVNAGTGNDTVTVGNSTDGLGDLNFESSVTVNGVAGHTTLVLNDQAGDFGYLLVSDTYAQQGFKMIDYANISNLIVDAQSAGSYEVDVVYTPASMMTTVNAGAGGDLVHLGGTFTGMAGEVLGPVTINGAGNTQCIAYDQRDATAQTYTVTATTFTDSGFSLTYSNLASLTINGGFANNVYAIQSTAAGMSVIINAGTSGDTVQLGGTSTGIAGLVHGPVTINGAGNTQCIAYAQTDATARTYTVTATTFADSGFSLTYSNLASLTINGGTASAFDVYAIQSTAAGTGVILNAGSGRNTFELGSGNSLNSLQGTVSVHGGVEADGLIANNSNSASGQSYTLSSTQLAGSDFAPITYAALATINVTGSGNDTLTLLTPVPTVATTFNAGSGTNTLQGANASNSWTISGVNSGRLDNVYFSNFQNLVGGNTTDIFYFTTSTASESSINGGAGSGVNRLDYSSLASSFPVTVNLATNSAPLISAGFSNINSVRGSADPANTLIAANTTNQWTISGNDAGSVNTVGFIAMDHLVGGTGLDSFQFSSTSGMVLSINGGGAPAQQGDWLNYSSWASTSTVTVNLATGSAANVNSGAAGAVTNIQNVIGSASGTNNLTGDAQGNVLVGGSGANTLTGGSGSSLLIGGSGHGSITGGSNSDILIAGSMTVNEAALMAFLAELQSADTFAQKVSDIIAGNNSGGGSDLNGSSKLTWGGSSPTVHASTGVFTLLGQTAATDWFFSNPSSTVENFNVQDEHNNNAIGVF